MKLTKNIGSVDRRLRLVPAVVFFVAWAGGLLSGTLLWVLGIVAAVSLVTAITGWCGLYTLLGINTCPLESPKS
ncbi:YgaP family membrane protein [Litorivicinus lipolyticus]|uniref:YgaP family membrane protein n=1 Tax=Litorivicinus lipolyticus TaxID=418701 RepID=UPI001B86AE01|nr:DUF2892 domain-containing protein [Litorivicinus lipolyticus]